MLTSHTTGSGKDAITIISHRDFPSFSVQVAHYGATLLSFHTNKEFGDMEILGGYRSLEDLHMGYASRNWVMAPFANRIPNGRYTWQGSEYVLPEGSRMHGLVAKEVWDLLDVSATEDVMELTFSLDSLSDGVEGYPFELLYTLTYTISLEGVTMEITATNIGEQDAPYFVGWHTYFTLWESTPDNLMLQIPSNTWVAMDSSLVPLDGKEAFVSRKKWSRLDYRKPKKIRKSIIDDYFVMQDNIPEAYLTNTSKKISIAITGERGCIIAFTSDPLEDAPRSAIAIEPMEGIANSFNRGDMQEQILLKAWTSRSYSASFALTGVELSDDDESRSILAIMGFEAAGAITAILS
jgi:aldose 1-epimerase